MKRQGRIVTLAGLFSSTAVALAAEEHAAHGAPSPSGLFLPLINFATFVGVFAYFAWPVIVSALAERRRLVEKDIAQADRVHAEASALLEEIRGRRDRLAEDAERLTRQIRTEAEHDRQRLVEEARRGAERIRADARLVTEQEAARAAKRIREELADQVVDRVVAVLRERLTRADSERFVREFAEAVEKGDVR
jgi:F0F1-type ATP synthase membrane subunit b/b'